MFNATYKTEQIKKPTVQIKIPWFTALDKIAKKI